MVRLILSAILVLVFSSTSKAQVFDEKHFDDGKHFIDIVTEDWRPYNFVDGGKLVGTSVETMRLVLEQAQVSYRMSVMPWARAYKTALEYPNHMIFSMKRIPEREPFFVWGRPLVVGGSIYPYRLKTRNDIKIRTVDDLRKYRTVTIRDSFEHQFLSNNDLLETAYLVSDIPQLFRMVAKNRIDYFLLQEETFPFETRKAGLSPELYINEPFEIKAASMYFAFNRQTSKQIIDRITHSFDKLKKGGQIR